MKKINIALFITLVIISIIALVRICGQIQEINDKHNDAFNKCSEYLWDNAGEVTEEEIVEMYNNYIK